MTKPPHPNRTVPYYVLNAAGEVVRTGLTPYRLLGAQAIYPGEIVYEGEPPAPEHPEEEPGED